MNVVVSLALLSLVGTAHARWEPLVAPQNLPRAPLQFLTQKNQSQTYQSQPEQEKQWHPKETHYLEQESQSVPHGTKVPVQKTLSPLYQTQRDSHELPIFPMARYPSPSPAPAALVPSSVPLSYSSHESVNVTLDGQTGEVSVVKVTIEKFKPGTLTSTLHQRPFTALLGGISGESAAGAGLNSFADPQPDDITFELYTSQNKGRYEALVATNASSVKRSAFDAKKWTVFVSHGFTGDADHSPWMHAVKDEFLKNDVNVVLVQWANLSSKEMSWDNYLQAVKNAKFVGAETGKLLHLLRDTAQLSADKLYLIGFSLGAHVVGFAGKAFPGIARITGLDPAGPEYEKVPASERLDKLDAKFVDVIHTNGGLCGYPGSLGHVDFYVNGGLEQPDCSFSKDLKGCSHYRAHELFITSMRFKDRSAKGFQCPDVNQYDAGKCLGNPFNSFGIHAHASKPGDYYMKTLVIEGDDSLYSSGRLSTQLFLQAKAGQVPDEDMLITVEFYLSNHSKDPVYTVILIKHNSRGDPVYDRMSVLVTTPLQVPILDLVTKLHFSTVFVSASKGRTMQLSSLVLTDTTINKRYSACNVTLPIRESVTVQFSDRDCPSHGSTNPWYF